MELEEVSNLVRAYDHARNERLKKEKEAASLKKEENHLKEIIIQTLIKADMGFAACGTRRVKLREKEVPKVSNWQELYAYVQKHEAYELLQRRISAAAVEERASQGEYVPGVERVVVYDLTIGNV